MENKSLNIFNSRLVLATPQIATDANYEAIEAVVAHEYFHNWTGLVSSPMGDMIARRAGMIDDQTTESLFI